MLYLLPDFGRSLVSDANSTLKDCWLPNSKKSALRKLHYEPRKRIKTIFGHLKGEAHRRSL